MRILNFGSLNIDTVYRVDHIVRPGETLTSEPARQFAGGKGANQSTALGRAGAPVFHAGKVGADGDWLLTRLRESGVDCRHVSRGTATGQAVIQVDRRGENAIFNCAGANREITPDDIARVFADFGAGDWLLLQNEVNAIPEMIAAARARGMRVAYNPAPFTPEVPDFPLQEVDLLILNETEARELAGVEEVAAAAEILRCAFPAAALLLTLGAAGAWYLSAETDLRVPGEAVEVVDTTGAGDTFIGYFLADRLAGADVESALRRACRAAAICVGRPGAGDSIPRAGEVTL